MFKRKLFEFQEQEEVPCSLFCWSGFLSLTSLKDNNRTAHIPPRTAKPSNRAAMKQCSKMSHSNRTSLLFLILVLTFVNLLEFSYGKEHQKLNPKDPSHRKQAEVKEGPGK